MINNIKPLFFFVLLFCAKPIFAQCKISGVVVNTTTKVPIGGASVVFNSSKKGISANSVGFFSISANCVDKDSISISAIGFNTLVVSIQDAIKIDSFHLVLGDKSLGCVVVKANKPTYTANKFDDCSLNYLACGNNTLSVAQSFFVPFDTAHIKRLTICKARGKSSFKILFYSFDTLKNRPLAILADTILGYGNVKRKANIDLSNLAIELTKGYYFVALEWIKTKENTYKQKRKIDGVPSRVTLYGPDICLSDSVEDPYAVALIKNDKNKWHTMEFAKRFLISVRLESIE
jgi:hypothetical protein